MHNITIQGGGIAKLKADGHAFSISDSLFIIDIHPDNLTSIIDVLEETKWGSVTVLQIELYDTPIESFQDGIGQLIDYIIYKNQHYCDRIFIMTTREDYTEAANAVWPEHKKAITKFRGREWPSDTFVKEFIPLQGTGTVSPAVEHLDMNDLVTWHWEVSQETGNVTETYDFNPPTEENLPKPLTHDVPFPEIPVGEDGDDASATTSPAAGGDEGGEGGATEYEINYVYHHEWTTMPIDENHAKPMGNFTASVEIPQNTVKIDHWKLVDCTCTIKEPPEGEDSGGGA